MKTKVLLLSSMLLLSGCEKIGQKVLNSMPDPSEKQAQVAQKAYDDLKDGNFEQFYTYLEPDLKAEFQKNEKELRKFSQGIPKQVFSSKKIVAKNIEKGTNKPSIYKVTYEYGYENKNLVQYDVSFDKAGGSEKIRDLNVSVFGGF
jgi:hypothetical protein